MTKTEYLTIASEQYDALQALNKVHDFYEYEKQFEQIWKETGRAVLEKNISELPTDWRKKKRLPNSGTSK